jgi:hypothetical protein
MTIMMLPRHVIVLCLKTIAASKEYHILPFAVNPTTSSFSHYLLAQEALRRDWVATCFISR